MTSAKNEIEITGAGYARLWLNGEAGEGKFTLIDNDDVTKLAPFAWYLSRGMVYPRADVGVGSGAKCFRYIHKLICDFSTVDHIDCDVLNNRKSNLRACSRSQNGANRKLNKNSTSGFKGVCYDKRKGLWMAYAMLNWKQIHIGYFDNVHVAAAAYDRVAREIFGEFARTNYVDVAEGANV